MKGMGTMSREWNFVDYADKPIVKPVHWDEHPEWFDQETGKALPLKGPRHMGPDGKRWTWGPSEWFVTMEDIEIIAFRWDHSSYSFKDQANHGVMGYAAWVNGVALDMVWERLDILLVDVVRFKYEGVRGSSGPRATEYFMRMVGGERQ
jgi:hypothetical protein